MSNQTSLESVVDGEKIMRSGRIILTRNFGSRVFATVKNWDETFQVSISRNDLGEDYQETKKKMKRGNVLEFEGEKYTSNSGQATLGVNSLKVLAKSEKSLPDKHNGLSRRLQQTQRGLHLLQDSRATAKFRLTNKIRWLVREYLHSIDFEEVDTGILKTVTDTSMSGEFETKGNWMNSPLYLRKSTEMRLKQLMVGGFERIYELGKEFRNVAVSGLFLPEFTALELYGQGMGYVDILNLTIGMLEHLNENVGEPSSKPTKIEQVHFYDFIKDTTGSDIRQLSTDEIKKLVSPEVFKDYGEHPALRGFYAYDVFRSQLRLCKDKNIVLHGVPLEVSPLAETYPHDPTLVQEFRYFVQGTSFCGGMSELTDPQVQLERIHQQAQYLGKSMEDHDDSFVETLLYGLPACGGLGLSLERLFMIYCEESNIKDVVYFPL